MPGALRNLVVLDLSRVLAGPLATMVMADLGANVIKIERPGSGDDTRAWGPPYGDDGTSTYFSSVNRNKSSVTLDLAGDEGRERVLALVENADVVVENFRPGVMDRLGLGYETLAAINPQLIYCSITGFGRAGGAQLPGYDLLVQAVGGLMSITGEPGGPAQKVGVALVDVITGLFATVGILAAVEHRHQSGKGQRVEVDLLTSLLAALVNQASAQTVAGVMPERLGNAHPSIAPYEVFRCADGELALAVGNDRQFQSLCDVLGDQDLAGNPSYRSNIQRVAHRDKLRTALEIRLAARGVQEWTELLASAGVPAGPVNDIAGAIELAQRLGLDPVISLERPDGSRVALVRNPITLSATPAAYRSAPPMLGADTEHVLSAQDD